MQKATLLARTRFFLTLYPQIDSFSTADFQRIIIPGNCIMFISDMNDLTIEKKSNSMKLKKMPENTSTIVGGILGDISSRSAYTQIFLGATSGWVTGLITMKVGKFAAFSLGGSIILLEIAHQEGYIHIDWSKLSHNFGKVTEKVEEAVTGEEKNWMDKAERYVDRKLDRAENTLKSKTKTVKKWYNKFIGDDNGVKLNQLHIFATAFVGGVALGIASA